YRRTTSAVGRRGELVLATSPPALRCLLTLGLPLRPVNAGHRLVTEPISAYGQHTGENAVTDRRPGDRADPAVERRLTRPAGAGASQGEQEGTAADRRRAGLRPLRLVEGTSGRYGRSGGRGCVRLDPRRLRS